METNEKKQFNLSLEDDRLIKTPRGETKKSVTNPWFYLGAFGNIGLSIAAPIVIGTLIGVQIDAKYNSKPTATLSGIVIGLIISIIGFLRMIQKIMRGDYNPK